MLKRLFVHSDTGNTTEFNVTLKCSVCQHDRGKVPKGIKNAQASFPPDLLQTCIMLHPPQPTVCFEQLGWGGGRGLVYFEMFEDWLVSLSFFHCTLFKLCTFLASWVMFIVRWASATEKQWFYWKDGKIMKLLPRKEVGKCFHNMPTS